ncbi:MAG: CNNM domain-containing protein [Anaerolineales bacterium]
MEPDIIRYLLAPTDPISGEMIGSFSGLLMFVMIALGFSFLCSILEAVLLSVSVSHLEVLIEKGDRAGRLMEKHKSNIERPISAILTLNTIAHTLGAAGAGAQAAAIYGSQVIGLFSAILTLLILFLSEIIPKTIGALYWKQLTSFTAYTIEVMIQVLFPFVWLSEKITRKLKPDQAFPTVTRLEMEAMARVSEKEGVMLEQENRVFYNLMHLQDLHVSTIMTPRTVVMALQQDQTVGEVLESISSFPFSRMPIYENDLDDAAMYVLRSEIFKLAARGDREVTLMTMGRSLYAIPETNPVADVLEDFIARKEQVFLVFDEHGGTEGIVTLEDVLESLLGIEITDETDLVEDLRQLALERYQRKLAETG